uniref:Vacuolar protein sorting-associated protein 72 homolog n=1 Tax=Ditylenchus dipsaci TaxID=166011 RepID=A0A915DIG3_9BILA
MVAAKLHKLQNSKGFYLLLLIEWAILCLERKKVVEKLISSYNLLSIQHQPSALLYREDHFSQISRKYIFRDRQLALLYRIDEWTVCASHSQSYSLLWTVRKNSMKKSIKEHAKECDRKEIAPVLAELMVSNRARRSTAGNKMAALLSSAAATDDFYDSAYGGFGEDDVDKNFSSPENSDADDVDSDFDMNEDEPEDEPANDAEEDHSKRDGKRNKLLSKNKKWVVARFDKFIVKENSCDSKTQQQRLLEAKKTVEENTESLKRFEEVEVERRRRQMKPAHKKAAAGRGFFSFPQPKQVKVFVRTRHDAHQVCAVTGLQAKYIDPLTDLPYANLDAFRIIRHKYDELLQSLNTEKEAMDEVPMGQT